MERSSPSPERHIVPGRPGLDSYARSEAPVEMTALRIQSLDKQLATILLGKSSVGLSDAEYKTVERAKSLMNANERLRFPNMKRTEIADLARDLAERFGQQAS